MSQLRNSSPFNFTVSAATLIVTSWPLHSANSVQTPLMMCVHVWGTEKTNGGVAERLPSLLHCSRLCHPDGVLLLIVIHELSRRVWGCFIATLPFWLQWLCDEALVACSQVQRVICLSVISMEWNGSSSRAFSLPITPGWRAAELLAMCIYLTDSWWGSCLTHMITHTHTRGSYGMAQMSPQCLVDVLYLLWQPAAQCRQQ